MPTAGGTPVSDVAASAAPSEAELLERAQGGDRRAYGRLVRLHQRRVWATAKQLVRSESDADDVTQEVFLRAWRALDRFDGRSKLSTWLYRITVNVSLNHIRKRKRRAAGDIDDPRMPEPPADPTQGQVDPARVQELGELQTRLEGAMGELSETLRSAVVLVLFQGLAHKEAAEILGCPEGTVAWRIHEARRKLKASLGDLAPEHAHPRSRGSGKAGKGRAS
ncbi:MAG: sigma-70 family RNA polymerase sigma factor [Myxococcota bacterium]